MFRNGKLKSFFITNRIASIIFRDNFSILTGIFSGKDDAEQAEFRRAFQSLVLPMLQSDGRFSEVKKNVYRRLLEEQFDRADAEHHLNELGSLSPLPETEAVDILKKSPPERAKKSAEFLLALAVALNETPEKINSVKRIAAAVNISKKEFALLYKELRAEDLRRKRLISSGHGVLAVLIIIAVFVLAAKFLQSVIFGLILACLRLPLENFFERHLREKRGLPYWLFAIGRFVTLPLHRLSAAISQKHYHQQPGNRKKLKEQRMTRHAVVFTAATAFLIAGLACWGIGSLTGSYMKKVQKNVQIWEARNISADTAAPVTTAEKVNFYLDNLQEKFSDIPVVSYGLDLLDGVINDPEMRSKALAFALKHGGGVSDFTSGMFGTIIAVASDILMTVFFALLFLLKMAEFCRDDNSDRSKSEYLVRSFFNGIWLPGADENVIREACRIIEGILFKLRVWLKGYLTLILVDATVYTTCFFFLGVPFFLPLGVIAGCGIVLPYLGPVLSCALTLLVTIVTGDASGGMLLTIIVCYLIYNGIIEQFILYPAVIGGALGLNTLETIIVVMLGAIFAGIPGMILALPTASVAKYIIPQIYRGLIKKDPSEKI